MHDVLPGPTRIEHVVARAILLLLLVGSAAVALPFLTALAWAFVMAFSLWPLQRRLVARLHQRRTLAALTMTSLITLVLLAPTLVIVINLADDARSLAHATKRWLADGPPASPQWLQNLPVVGTRSAAYWDALSSEATHLMQKAGDSSRDDSVAITPSPDAIASAPVTSESKLAATLRSTLVWARQWIPPAGLAIVRGFTQILLSVLLTFFIFRDGEALAQRLHFVIERIGGQRGVQLLTVAGSTVRGVVYGILGTALVQGVMAGVGFFLAGVPGAALLGLVTFFVSPIPVGPPLIWIPATAWLFHQDQMGWGIFMIVWGIALSSIDNIIKPLIISRGNATPFILVLFGIVGGALTFGFIGVFLGPTLLAVVYKMVEQWSRQVPLAASTGDT